MQIHNLKSVELADGVTFTFPSDICANCGATSRIEVHEQEARVTTFLLFGGTEITFSLPIPTCENCSRTLLRRPLSLANKGLIALLVSCGIATISLLATTLNGLSIPVLSAYPLSGSLILGVVICTAYFSSHRAKSPQTSYYHPVRIKRLRRRFIDSTVEHIGFAFTNKEYRMAFARQNEEGIRAGRIAATDA